MTRLWAPGDHVHISYATDKERRRVLGMHLTAALERGEKIAYLAYGVREEVLLDWLSDAGPDLKSITAREQLVVWPAIDFGCFPEFLPAKLRSAEQAGYAGLRVCVDMAVTVNGTPGHEALLARENQLATLFADGELLGLTLICHYDRRRRGDQQLRELTRGHSVVLTAQQAEHREPLLRMTPLERQRGLRLSGEIDGSNRSQFSTALKSAFRDDHDFHLDLTDLHYVDVATVKLLAGTAAKLCNGHQFVLESPGPLVRTILHIYGWDRLPALRVVTGTASR